MHAWCVWGIVQVFKQPLEHKDSLQSYLYCATVTGKQKLARRKTGRTMTPVVKFILVAGERVPAAVQIAWPRNKPTCAAHLLSPVDSAGS
jgi:hypothetical protein